MDNSRKRRLVIYFMLLIIVLNFIIVSTTIIILLIFLYIAPMVTTRKKDVSITKNTDDVIIVIETPNNPDHSDIADAVKNILYSEDGIVYAKDLDLIKKEFIKKYPKYENNINRIIKQKISPFLDIEFITKVLKNNQTVTFWDASYLMVNINNNKDERVRKIKDKLISYVRENGIK